MGQHLVDDRHHQQRREDGQEAERQRGEADIAQRAPLLQHEAGEPAQRERRIGCRRSRALARSSTASPAQTSASRSSSTGTGRLGRRRVGSLTKTTFCSALAPVSSPAVPSLNSSTTGPASSKRSRCRQRSRTARAHMPAFCAQADKRRRRGAASPGRRAESFGSSSMPVIPAGDDHRHASADGPRFRRPSGLDRHAVIGTTAGIGQCMTLPRRSGGMSVINIHA